MNILKKTNIALACAALSFGATSVAQAGAHSFSALQVTLGFVDAGTGTSVDAGQLGVLNISDSSSNTADLNSVPGTTITSSLTSVNSPMACEGTCGGIAENNFTAEGPNPALNFARSDSAGSGALITGTIAGAPPATVDVVSEVNLNQNDIGFTGTNTQDTSGFTFSTIDDITVRLDLTASGMLRAMLNPDVAVPPSIAGAGYTWTISIQDNDANAEIFNWSPNDLAGGITGGTELNDSIDLTNSVSQNVPGGDTGLLAFAGSAQATVDLTTGTNYSLRIVQTTNANATKEVAVPEPSIIGLLGVGLFGMQFVARRKKIAA